MGTTGDERSGIAPLSTPTNFVAQQVHTPIRTWVFPILWCQKPASNHGESGIHFGLGRTLFRLPTESGYSLQASRSPFGSDTGAHTIT